MYIIMMCTSSSCTHELMIKLIIMCTERKGNLKGFDCEAPFTIVSAARGAGAAVYVAALERCEHLCTHFLPDAAHRHVVQVKATAEPSLNRCSSRCRLEAMRRAARCAPRGESSRAAEPALTTLLTSDRAADWCSVVYATSRSATSGSAISGSATSRSAG